MKEQFRKYATLNVPRYTSYPTAPHFKDSISPGDYAGALAALPAGMPLSLYIHVPFCRSMCHYCGCHTKVVRKADPIHAYALTLKQEVDLLRGHLGPGRRITHLHWGGGTPSMLAAPDFKMISEAVAEAFEAGEGSEHAIELDPRTVDDTLVAMLVDAGINRVSLGVQDFTPHVQEAIGRVQPYDEVRDVVARLRAADLEAINFDLMYGLPDQSVADLRRTIDQAAALKPARIALFGYAHVPWFKKHQRLIDEAALPGAVARFGMAEQATDYLAEVGYARIGFDHFALPDDHLAGAARDGALHRNFQGYTTDAAPALLGLGASSIGRLPEMYIQNALDIGGWRRAIEAGELPVVRGKRVSGDDLFRAEIIERLMCDMEADVAEIAVRHGRSTDALAASRARVEDLSRDGLVWIDGWHVKMAGQARALVRVVAAAFDSYFVPEQSGHSAAV